MIYQIVQKKESKQSGIVVDFKAILWILCLFESFKQQKTANYALITLYTR